MTCLIANKIRKTSLPLKSGVAVEDIQRASNSSMSPEVDPKAFLPFLRKIDGLKFPKEFYSDDKKVNLVMYLAF